MLDPRQEELYQAWCHETKVRKAVPPREWFDPVDFPQALSTLVLYERVEDDKLCLRVIGTDIVRAWGTDHTGRCLHEFMQGEYHDFIRDQIDQCIEQRVPIFSHSQFRWDAERAVDTRRLLLPIARSEGSEDIGFVLLSQVFDYGKVGPTVPIITAGEGMKFEELERHALAVHP